MMATNTALITFTDTIKIPRLFLLTIGLNTFPIKCEPSQRTVKWNFFFTLGVWNLRVLVTSYWIHLYKLIAESGDIFADAVMVPCLVGSILSDFKVMSICRNRKHFDRILKFLNEKFPIRDRQEQEYFGLVEVQKETNKILKIFIFVMFGFVWSYNVAGIVQDGVEMALGLKSNFSYPLQYKTWTPFRTDRPWTYVFYNVHVMSCSHIVGHWFIGVDGWMLKIIYMTCMHFDNISKCLRDRVVKGTEEDFTFLKEQIRRHDEILQICEHINGVFSDYILVSFVTSVLIICFMAFCLTMSQDYADVFQQSFSLASIVLQNYLVCWSGERLIRSSVGVGQSVYEHDWFNAEMKYKKAMILFIERAQRPAFLTASFFAVASHETFKEIMTSSYQFFTILHSMVKK